MTSTVPVRVNTRAMRQPFHPCTATFIADVCQARCCRSTTDPTGIAVTVTPSEAVTLRRRGAEVETGGRLVPRDRRCPFQCATTHLCELHGTGDKPSGCVVSPFTVNANNTLIVRNRYRFLPCFKADGAVPVAVAHHTSLVALFGAGNAGTIRDAALDAQCDPSFLFDVPASMIEMLRHKNEASRSGGGL